jgi:hypothetical protein
MNFKNLILIEILFLCAQLASNVLVLQRVWD